MYIVVQGIKWHIVVNCAGCVRWCGEAGAGPASHW